MLPHLSLNLSGTRVWPLCSICESGRQAIVSLHHQPSCQIMSTTYHEINSISSKPHNITVNGNNSNRPLPDSIRSPREFHRCLCILKVRNPAHSMKLS